MGDSITWQPRGYRPRPNGVTVNLEYDQAWREAARKPYPGIVERRAMEYLGQPALVQSGRDRLGE